jgi:integrase
MFHSPLIMCGASPLRLLAVHADAAMEEGDEAGGPQGHVAQPAPYARLDLDRGWADVLTISRRLGHGTPAITLNVYAHLFTPDDRAASIIEKALAATEEG